MNQYEIKLSEKEDAELDAEFKELEKRIQKRKSINANKSGIFSDREGDILLIQTIACSLIAGAFVIGLLYSLFYFVFHAIIS